MKGVIVREFKKKTFLSSAKKCKIEEIGDIGVVDDLVSEGEGQVEEGLNHSNVCVAAVEALTSYNG